MTNTSFVPGYANPNESGEDHLKSQLRSMLRALNGSALQVEASAIISGDGLIIASVLDEKADPDRFAAMCASLLALASRAANEIARGQLKQVLIEGEVGSVLLVYAGDNTVLAVAVKNGANLGMVFHASKKVAQKVDAIWNTRL